jgi:nitroimidazol reductase NimA-like FMN-containing flavoprotein (pyridoxamine 5'-phosphate oxidase superfamily)
MEMMEMDSPFHQHYGAMIEGKHMNVLKKGQTITLTCKVIENENSKSNNEQHSRRIDWMKDGELVSLKVMQIKQTSYASLYYTNMCVSLFLSLHDLKILSISI